MPSARSPPPTAAKLLDSWIVVSPVSFNIKKKTDVITDLTDLEPNSASLLHNPLLALASGVVVCRLPPIHSSGDHMAARQCARRSAGRGESPASPRSYTLAATAAAMEAETLRMSAKGG